MTMSSQLVKSVTNHTLWHVMGLLRVADDDMLNVHMSGKKTDIFGLFSAILFD